MKLLIRRGWRNLLPQAYNLVRLTSAESLDLRLSFLYLSEPLEISGHATALESLIRGSWPSCAQLLLSPDALYVNSAGAAPFQAKAACATLGGFTLRHCAHQPNKMVCLNDAGLTTLTSSELFKLLVLSSVADLFRPQSQETTHALMQAPQV